MDEIVKTINAILQTIAFDIHEEEIEDRYNDMIEEMYEHDMAMKVAYNYNDDSFCW